MRRSVKWIFAETSQARLFRRLILIVLALAIGLSGIILALDKFGISNISTDPHTSQPNNLPMTCQNAAQSENPTKAENLCPGTTAWRPDHPLGSEHAIEGFSAPISVNVGEQVKFYVSTTAPSYSLQIFRLGWYQGLGGRLMYSVSTLTGIKQPAPTIDPATRMVSCSNWRNPISVHIPTNWVSGVYIVKLLSSQGYLRYIYFVVRNDASTAPILFQTSVLTYEAYNMWGGYDLYRGINAQGQYVPQMRSYVVSFDRPFERQAGADNAPSYEEDSLDEIGLGDFPLYSEYPMLRWMERSGYDMTYSTDIDTDMRGSLLLNHRLYISAGHDEYWSTSMRNAVTKARNQGVSLGFFSGNDVYWHIRLQSSSLGPDREVVCYKPGYYSDHITDPLEATKPQEATVRWEDSPLDNPENSLLGEAYGGGVQTLAPLVLTSGAIPFMKGTGLHVGSALPELVGGEYDRISLPFTTPSLLTVLAASPLKCVPSSQCPKDGKDTANATLYTLPNNARVFDGGTFLWGWGLDNDNFVLSRMHSTSTPGFQKLTANLIAYLLGSSE